MLSFLASWWVAVASFLRDRTVESEEIERARRTV
jgi:hypothetical protein